MRGKQSALANDITEAAFSLGAALLLAGSPWLVDTSGPYPFYKGPLLFPLIALAITMLAGIPACTRLVRHRAQLSGWRPGVVRPPFSARLFVLMCLFPAAMLVVGLDAATWIFMLAGFWLAGYRNATVALATATVMTIVVHIAFHVVLDIWFPTPILSALFGTG